jgi:hypothetical protein
MSAKERPPTALLTRERILAALGALSDELGKRGVTGEICLFGGTVMVLAFTARLSTKDVDAIFSPPELIRDLAQQIGEQQQLPANWLNDAVKGYVSDRHETAAANLPQFPHLRLTMRSRILACHEMHGRTNRWHNGKTIRRVGHLFSHPPLTGQFRQRSPRPYRSILSSQSHSGQNAVFGGGLI